MADKPKLLPMKKDNTNVKVNKKEKKKLLTTKQRVEKDVAAEVKRGYSRSGGVSR